MKINRWACCYKYLCWYASFSVFHNRQIIASHLKFLERLISFFYLSLFIYFFIFLSELNVSLTIISFLPTQLKTECKAKENIFLNLGAVYLRSVTSRNFGTFSFFSIFWHSFLLLRKKISEGHPYSRFGFYWSKLQLAPFDHRSNKI